VVEQSKVRVEVVDLEDDVFCEHREEAEGLADLSLDSVFTHSFVGGEGELTFSSSFYEELQDASFDAPGVELSFSEAFQEAADVSFWEGEDGFAYHPSTSWSRTSTCRYRLDFGAFLDADLSFQEAADVSFWEGGLS
jgi:hypothetical protein